MIKVEIFDLDKKQKGTLELEPKVFGLEPNLNLIHRVFQWFRTEKRQATASTKTKGEVSGGGRKPWRQKGTGRARVGSIRSPLWRGGGVTFGPRPRIVEDFLPKKAIKKGMRLVLSDLVKNNNLVVLSDEAKMPEKTKAASQVLEKLGLVEEPILIISGGANIRAFRNLKNVSVLENPVQLNIEMVLKCSKILTFPKAIKEIEAVLKP